MDQFTHPMFTNLIHCQDKEVFSQWDRHSSAHWHVLNRYIMYNRIYLRSHQTAPNKKHRSLNSGMACIKFGKNDNFKRLSKNHRLWSVLINMWHKTCGKLWRSRIDKCVKLCGNPLFSVLRKTMDTNTIVKFNVNFRFYSCNRMTITIFEQAKTCRNRHEHFVEAAEMLPVGPYSYFIFWPTRPTEHMPSSPFARFLPLVPAQQSCQMRMWNSLLLFKFDIVAEEACFHSEKIGATFSATKILSEEQTYRK